MLNFDRSVNVLVLFDLIDKYFIIFSVLFVPLFIMTFFILLLGFYHLIKEEDEL